MNKEFIPYEQALELKELGFYEPCFGWFASDKSLITEYTNKTDFLLAPTFSQAFRFLRKEYKIRHNITDFIDDKEGIEWDYEIAFIGTDVDEKGNYEPLVGYSTDDENRKFKSYEGAELACLRKLIEIAKGQG